MKKSISRIAILLFISLFAIGNGVMAAGGNGGGNGGGSNEPLGLVSSTVANGATGVAKDVKITLVFSKNVTFDTVRVSNEKAFSMVDQDGKTVAIKVILAESTNEAEKDNVVIKAVNDLEEGNKYTLTINGNLESKSGATLGSSQKITFSTIEKVASQDTKVNNTATNDSKTKNSSSTNNSTTNSSSTDTSSTHTSQTKATNPKTGDEITTNIIFFLASTFIFCGYMSLKFYKRRMN